MNDQIGGRYCLALRKTNNYGKAILVTGGAGFVGSHLVDRLISEGARVSVLDNLSSGIKANLAAKRVEFTHGDIRDGSLVDSLVEKSDTVFHLAEYIPNTRGYGSGHVIKYSVENPLLDFDVSCFGSLVVLEKCRKYDKSIVFASSAAVYGENTTSSINEESSTVPSSPYGVSKLCAEKYMELYSRLYKLPVTVLRFCNLYGPRQRKYLMYDILLKLSNDQNKLKILGTGFEQRDFIYVDDAINAVLLAAESPKTDNVIFNVGTGTSVSVKEVVETIIGILDIRPEVVFTQTSWKGDIKKLGASVEKIRQLGFSPTSSLENGLKKTIAWFKNTHQPNGQINQ